MNSVSTDSCFPAATQIDAAVGSGQPIAAAKTELSPFAFPRPTDAAVKNAMIMIVDDEEAVTRLVRRHLKDAGFQNFETISKSDKALARITTSTPDLVLLDLRMKPVNGIQILEDMRRNRCTQQIPVIILTSATDETIKITALNLGADDFLKKPVNASELVSRVRNTLSVKAYRDLATEYSVKLESDVLCDALTGIANRRAFEYELKRRMSEWNRRRTPLGLLMIDVDHFKSVNDRYGHGVGDTALRGVADELKASMREMDLVARYGGDEFAVILPSTTSTESKEAADRARSAVAASSFSVSDCACELTVSVGIANAMNGDDADLLLRRADSALYAAKQHGRNCCFFHDGASCVAPTEPMRTADVRDSHRWRQSHYSNRPAEEMKIAIVDDEPATIAVVRKYLKDAGFQNFLAIDEAVQALDTIKREEPDIVLLDIRMPKVSGLEILEGLRNDNSAKPVPVLIFTSDTDKKTKVAALSLGASDFLEKPVDASELLARVNNTLLAKSHLDNLANYSNTLEHEVQLRTEELSASRREALRCLARAAELRDDQTGQYVFRVGRYAAIIAEELGFSEERVTLMEHAVQLHDVGKIGVPDAILRKPGRLSAQEFEVMKEHCVTGVRIIRDEVARGSEPPKEHEQLGMNIGDNCNSPIMQLAALVAQTHHEKWDGSGYPCGLAGEAIPIEGRIAAVADVFDALSTERPYKKAIPLEECFTILEENRGSHFDPDVLDAFLRRRSEIVRTYYDYSEVRQVVSS